MQRVLVAALAAVDALVAACVGLAAVLAPFTLLWIAVFREAAAWDALWPATARVWQLGHLVPVHIGLGDTAADLGIPDDGSAFWVSVAPLLFAAFTLLFAARSGRRAAASGASLVGFGAGVLTIAAFSALVAVTSANPVAEASTWQAIVLPTAVYAAGHLGGIVRAAWGEGDGGAIDRIHEMLDGWGPAWREVPALVVKGATVVIVGLVGAAALLFAALVALRGGEMISLFERAQVDAVGATALTLAQLAYVPTLLGWGVAWFAGPGFALGTGTAVSPSGTSLGVVPGVPILGVLPESGSGWMLLAVLLPVALGALAGWIARRAYAHDWAFDGDGHEHFSPRVAIAAGIAVCSGAAAAIIAAASSGAMGPGRLADVGPDPGPVALTIGLEALVGAAILLLAPMRRPITEADWAELGDDDEPAASEAPSGRA
ncbi:cell division protein PerM [Microbacterium karelineae]|uniref:cell division protein PerM n=1 Tax=Microbacterium karelineae TaxID=2654283 RepID=UPI0012EA1CB9|nr:DUF6350 family protein [Microbacterium karelineae]